MKGIRRVAITKFVVRTTPQPFENKVHLTSNEHRITETPRRVLLLCQGRYIGRVGKKRTEKESIEGGHCDGSRIISKLIRIECNRKVEVFLESEVSLAV